MVDREKVLHGLSSCGTDYGVPNICEITECPYRENKALCIHELAHDANALIHELLQAQEARKRLEVHNVGNVDIPDGVTWEQFQAVMDGVVKALEHTDNGESWPYTEQEANNEVVYRDHG